MVTAPIRQLYDRLATTQPQAIAPVIDPLVRNFINTMPLPAISDGLILDIGTGFGFAAQQLAAIYPHTMVIGLDVSPAMLQTAQAMPSRVRWLCADLTEAPLATESIKLITASLALNLTDPRPTLRALYKLLQPGGSLLIQEWAAEDRLSIAFDQTFGLYTDADPALIEWVDNLPDSWPNQMQDVEDYRDQLQTAGFTLQIVEEQFAAPILLDSAETFIAYKLAWPTYRAAWDRLDRDQHQRLHTALLDTLYDGSDDGLVWQPSVFRMLAHKQI